MPVSAESLNRKLEAQRGEPVRVVRRAGGGRLMLDTGRVLPDGDGCSIYVSESPGGLCLSDLGSTLMHISLDCGADAFLSERGALLKRVLAEERVGFDGCSFHADTPAEGLRATAGRFGRALLRIEALADTVRP